MIKPEQGKVYETKFGQLTYTGKFKGSNYNCDLCHKERWTVHEFQLGKVGNPTAIYHFGTNCVKQFLQGECNG